MLEREKELRIKEVQRKRECLQELLVQQICFRNLIQRNRQKEALMMKETETVSLPFIVVNTCSDAEILCKGTTDWTDVMFDFSHPFEINDDSEILKRLGLDKTTSEELRRMLPHDLLSYCQEHHLLDSVILPGHDNMSAHHYSSHQGNFAYSSSAQYSHTQGPSYSHHNGYY